MLRYLFIFMLLISSYNCKEKEHKSPSPEKLTADAIVKTAIDTMGGIKVDQSDISFDFRDLHFRAVRNHGKFHLERQFTDSVPEIKDVLNNSGFERYIGGQKVSLIDSMIPKYSGSVNSVHYFSILPYGLDGKAVHKTYLDSIEIKGNPYHKIKVTFSEDGGGEDYEDEYIYWINTNTYTVDYLAYTYKENTGGQGFRFREAYHPRKVNGIRFVDYNNYKPSSSEVNLKDLDSLFMTGQLEEVSKIELKNIEVKLLN